MEIYTHRHIVLSVHGFMWIKNDVFSVNRRIVRPNRKIYAIINFESSAPRPVLLLRAGRKRTRAVLVCPITRTSHLRTTVSRRSTRRLLDRCSRLRYSAFARHGDSLRRARFGRRLGLNTPRAIHITGAVVRHVHRTRRTSGGPDSCCVHMLGRTGHHSVRRFTITLNIARRTTRTHLTRTTLGWPVHTGGRRGKGERLYNNFLILMMFVLVSARRRGRSLVTRPLATKVAHSHTFRLLGRRGGSPFRVARNRAIRNAVHCFTHRFSPRGRRF